MTAAEARELVRRTAKEGRIPQRNEFSGRADLQQREAADAADAEAKVAENRKRLEEVVRKRSINSNGLPTASATNPFDKLAMEVGQQTE